jgi:GxxExxY protein
MKLNDITYAINGAVFEVNEILGPGFLEKVYENALLVNFKHKKADIKRMVLDLPEGLDG